MKIGIVTTFSDNGYKEYGHWFVESVHKFIDENINVFFYTDNVDIKLKSNITNQRLEKSIPDLTKFKNRNKDKSPSNFMFDAVRFSHKSYCLYHAAKTKDVDLLCWLDTDTEIISKITPNYIQNFMEKLWYDSGTGRVEEVDEEGADCQDSNSHEG